MTMGGGGLFAFQTHKTTFLGIKKAVRHKLHKLRNKNVSARTEGWKAVSSVLHTHTQHTAVNYLR